MEKYNVEFSDFIKVCNNYNEAEIEKDSLIKAINKGEYDNKEMPFDFLVLNMSEQERRLNMCESIFISRKQYTSSGILKNTINLDKEGNEIQKFSKKPIIIEDIPIYLHEKDDTVYVPGGMICDICPFFDVPLQLSICICPDGDILHRGWHWVNTRNPYLHTISEKENVTVTKEMEKTIAGLFSGRIKFKNIKLAVGATVQEICPIDIKKEEQRTGQTIYLA